MLGVLVFMLGVEFGRIEGTVVDEGRGTPLSLVHIIVKGTGLGAVTDRDGRFFIEVSPGEYKVLASRIGYKTVEKLVTVEAGKTSRVDFELKETAIEIGGVVVTATKTEKVLLDVPMEMNVVTRFDIKESNAKTTADVLKYIPGIDVNTHSNEPGNLDWRAKFRGLDFNTGYALVLVNGQRVKGGGMGEAGYGLNQLPPEMIERIEVLKGPSSVLYGSDAVSGVVNIITKSIPPRRLFSSFIGYGTDATFKEGFSYGDRLNNFGYLFMFNAEKSKMGKYGREDEYEARYADAIFSCKLARNSGISLRLDYNKLDWEYNKEEKEKVSPEFKFGLRDGSKFLIRGYFLNWYFNYFTPGYTPKLGHMRYYEGEAQYSRVVLGHEITLGGEYLREFINYQLVKNKTVETYAMYLQDDWELSRFNLVSGMRFDYHSQFGKEINPRVSAMLELTSSTRLRVSCGRSFKSPTIRQLYYTEPFQHKDYYIVSNPNLKPEHGTGYSLGLEQIFGNVAGFNISVFRNDLKDMVASYWTGDTIDGLPVKSYENVDKAYTQGIELMLKLQLLRGLMNSFSYRYLDARNKETGKYLRRCPPHVATWKFRYHNKRYGFGINYGVKYVSSSYRDSENEKKIDSYWVAEANVSKKLTKYSGIQVSCDNIFETDYGEPERNYPGRTVMCKVYVSF